MTGLLTADVIDRVITPNVIDRTEQSTADVIDRAVNGRSDLGPEPLRSPTITGGSSTIDPTICSFN